MVVVLLGITSAMFSTLLTVVGTRSTQITKQNVLQTEGRAALDQMVGELRNASYGDITPPITTYLSNEMKFYSPDRQQPYHMREIRYIVAGNALKREEKISTNTGGPPWTFPASPRATQTLFDSIVNPITVFRYCTQTPRDLAVQTGVQTMDLITWTCTAATTASNVKTVLVTVGVLATNRPGIEYRLGAVATIRMNAA